MYFQVWFKNRRAKYRKKQRAIKGKGKESSQGSTSSASASESKEEPTEDVGRDEGSDKEVKSANEEDEDSDGNDVMEEGSVSVDVESMEGNGECESVTDNDTTVDSIHSEEPKPNGKKVVQCVLSVGYQSNRCYSGISTEILPMYHYKHPCLTVA